MIAEAAKASGRSVRSLAANARISDTRWRHIVKGWQPVPKGGRVEVRAPAETLARMAGALGLTPEDLRNVGRVDAANAMDHEVKVPPRPFDEINVDEIDLIYRSDMSDKAKLEAIRKVLELRDRIRRAQSGVASAGTTAFGAVARTESEGRTG